MYTIVFLILVFVSSKPVTSEIYTCDLFVPDSMWHLIHRSFGFICAVSFSKFFYFLLDLILSSIFIITISSDKNFRENMYNQKYIFRHKFSDDFNENVYVFYMKFSYHIDYLLYYYYCKLSFLKK